VNRRLGIVLLALAVPLLAATPAGAAPYAARLTLRLSDVGPGYLMGDDSGCGVIAGEGATWELTQIYLDHPHLGCAAQLTEMWAPVGSPPRPSAITSAAYLFRDTTGPALELQQARDVVAYVAGVARDSLTPLSAPAIGDEAVAFRTDDALVLGRANRPGAIVLWRSGRVLALVLAADLRADVVSAATWLADAQQRRIANPSPLRPGENDDAEVPLDDPGLAPDVRWLGHDLRPRGLPRLVLRESSIEGDNGAVATLRYGSRPYNSDVQLDLWRRADWRRLVRTRFGQLVWHERCARATSVPVPVGRAVIYAGYERPQKHCGDTPPDRFLAHVVYKGVVVAVNAVGCFRCRDATGPYDSRAGMRAVVRAMRPRTPAANPLARPAPPAAASAPTAARAASGARA